MSTRTQSFHLKLLGKSHFSLFLKNPGNCGAAHCTIGSYFMDSEIGLNIIVTANFLYIPALSTAHWGANSSLKCGSWICQFSVPSHRLFSQPIGLEVVGCFIKSFGNILNFTPLSIFRPHEAGTRRTGLEKSVHARMYKVTRMYERLDK